MDGITITAITVVALGITNVKPVRLAIF